MYIMLTNYKGLNLAMAKTSVNSVENHYYTFSAKNGCQKSPLQIGTRKFAGNIPCFSILVIQPRDTYVIIVLRYEVMILG